MCCFFTTLVLFGPRLAILIWWLVQPARWYGTAASAFDSWFWPILGLIFLPWTTIMYVLVFPGGIVGFDWLWLGLGLLADIASYSGGVREGYGRVGAH